MFVAITQALITQYVQNRLLALKTAINEVYDLEQWMTGVSLSDLETAGFSPADAQALKTACADAAAFWNLYNNQNLPGGYTLPYNFGASQRAILGPQ
jgi:hypothetical protein